MKMQMEMQMGMEPEPSSEWVGVWAWAWANTRAWDLGLGTLGLGGALGGLDRGREEPRNLDSTRLDSTFSASCSCPRWPISCLQGPGSVPGPGHLTRGTRQPQVTYCRVQSRYLTIPLAARRLAKYRPRSHLANDGTTQPTQPSNTCWGPARLSRLVLPRRGWCCPAVPICQVLRAVDTIAVVSSSFWALTGSSSSYSTYPSLHPSIRTHDSRPYCPELYVHYYSIHLQPSQASQVSVSPACASTRQLHWDG